MKNQVLLALIIAMAIVGGLLLLRTGYFSPRVACTMEAKICPDGTSVGRVPPKCEFAPCSSDGLGKDTGISGTVLLGPTCPVIKDPPEGKCEDKPFATDLVITSADGARVIKEFSSDENGNFGVSVEPGEYAIRSAGASNILPYCASEGTVLVGYGPYTEVVINCDTGIR